MKYKLIQDKRQDSNKSQIPNPKKSKLHFEFHPSKVVWLKHTAVTSFTFDRGGMFEPGKPPYHYVTPGVDLEFPNNGFMPYPED